MKNEEQNNFEFFKFRTFSGINQSAQIVFITLLYVLMTVGYYFQVKVTGKMDGYSPGVSLLFVPLYEELIFRGLMLRFFEKYYGMVRGIIFVSILFGLWHLKNIFWLEANALSEQIVYTALFFSPVTCWITLKTRSVWPAVMIHYLNNFPYQAWIENLKNWFSS